MLNDLTPIPGADFDQAQWLAGTEFSAYEAVFIEAIDVSFRKNWQRDQNRYDSTKVRDKDVERIKQDTAALLHETLLSEFTENGFTLATAPGPGVLVLKPSITKLDIIAPDTPSASRRMTYSEYTGEMTLNIEITDGQDDVVLAVVTDRQRDFAAATWNGKHG